MIKKTTFILLLALLTQQIHAQEYSFRVLASNGKSTVKGSKKGWKDLKTGAKLYDGDEVKLGDGGYLGLVHLSGKTIELSELKVYDISKLSSELLGGSKNLVSKYADYVMSKMSPETKEENRRKYASVTGSVERSALENNIQLYLSKITTVLNETAIIRWASNLKDPIYIVSVKNIFGEELLKIETTDSFYILNFRQESLMEGLINDFVIIQVSQKNGKMVKSESASIKKIDEEHAADLVSSLVKLQTNIGEESSLNNMILAEFYEENDLVLDATTCYEKAINQSPGIDYFQDAYNEFLIRNGFVNPQEVDIKANKSK